MALLYTVNDVIGHLRDWAGVATDQNTTRMAYRSIVQSMDALMGVRDWSYYRRPYHVSTVASYSTGTVEYTASTRTLTLTSGTWPTWAARGRVIISDVHYPVLTRSSSSALILSSDQNPGSNIAAGTAYQIYQDIYPLPSDFVSILTRVKDVSREYYLSAYPLDEMLDITIGDDEPGEPLGYAIVRDRAVIGPTNPVATAPTMAMMLKPPPETARTYGFFYRFHPRTIKVPLGNYETGTVSSSSTTITGVGTAWTSDMEGAVIRFGTTTAIPGGYDSANKYAAQRIVTAVASATSLTIDSALSSEVSGVKYSISDPLDIEPGAMWSAFLRKCEHELAIQRHKDDPAAIDKAEARWIRACREAMAADSRHPVEELPHIVDRRGTISFPA